MSLQRFGQGAEGLLRMRDGLGSYTKSGLATPVITQSAQADFVCVAAISIASSCYRCHCHAVTLVVNPRL